MRSVAGAPPRAVAGDDVHAAIFRLSAALEAEAFAGWDPYDALSSPVPRAAARTPFLRRAAIQSLKRLPVNVRPLLGIPRQRHTKGLALLVSAYTLLAQREDGGRFRPHALELGRRLPDRAVPAGTAWGGATTSTCRRGGGPLPAWRAERDRDRLHRTCIAGSRCVGGG